MWVPVVSGSEGFAVGTALVESVLGSCDKAALFRLSCVTFESFHGDLLHGLCTSITTCLFCGCPKLCL